MKQVITIKLFILGFTLIFSCSDKSKTTSKTTSSTKVNALPSKSTKDTLSKKVVEKKVLTITKKEEKANMVFRKAVRENEKNIEKYYGLIQTFKKRGFNVEDRANWKNQINQKYQKDLAVIMSDSSKLHTKELMLVKAKKVGQLESLQAEKNQLLVKKKNIQKRRTILLNNLRTLDEYKTEYEESVKAIQANISNLFGEVTFTYNQESYTAYVADLSKHTIAIHLKSNNRHFSKLSNLKDSLEKQGKEVLMVTNAGMFHYTQDPVGLYIEKGKEKNKINLEPVNGDNFHLAPNGVFYIDEKGVGIQETHRFLKEYKAKKIRPISATQSGPMLVIDGKHHHKFNHGSKSRKLRSGVGLLPNNRIIFIISDRHNTNFFQFGTIYKDLFACQQALFLDGAISEMYIKGNSKNLKGGNFGPMLSITAK